MMLTKNIPAPVSRFLSLALATVLLATSCTTQNKQSENKKTSAMADTTNTNTNGTTITLGGQQIHTVGKLPAVGTQIKDFTLTGTDLQEKKLADFTGKYLVMNIFPSVNTGVCSKSVREFNKDATSLKNTSVLCISKDLPFAQKAFCGAEGIDNVVMLSDFRNDFGHEYGVLITDGPMKGLLSRAVIVVDPEGKIVYEQQVPEIGQEPDYASALAAVK
jgi:thiol peroxidase